MHPATKATSARYAMNQINLYNNKPKLSSMKKISTLLLAAAATAFAASAQLTPVEIELKNPSLEETPEGATGNQNVVPMQWGIIGAAWYNEDGTASNFCAMQDRPKSWTDGRFGIRSGFDINIEGANYMYQELTDQKLGTYVFQFDGQISRNSFKGTLEAIEGAEGFAFILDDLGDETDRDTNGEGMTAIYTKGQSLGNNFFQLWRYFLIHTTSADLEDATNIKVGFGYPECLNADGDVIGISKARIACDNFRLLYFDTTDTEAVKAYVNDQIAKIKAGDFSAPTAPEEGAEPVPVPMNIANPFGGANTALAGFVTNSGYVDEGAGINDIAAPAVKGDNKYYNLQGIEIAKPTQAGLYIHNGKKYIVR